MEMEPKPVPAPARPTPLLTPEQRLQDRIDLLNLCLDALSETLKNAIRCFSSPEIRADPEYHAVIRDRIYRWQNQYNQTAAERDRLQAQQRLNPQRF